MEQSESHNKGKIYMQTTLEQRQTASVFLEMRARTGSHDIEEDDIMDLSKQATSSASSEKERTATSKPVRNTASLCFIYDVDIRHFGEVERDWRRRGPQ